ncbi:MAG: DUF4406 domain-containing protein [Sodalis sp. (in: enterobacteria)]|uniref:DUF4406 domain-containing protein n=1 Tax=Sodalis sp. (in: enterobacteria) TaxID=1898979 RepID=UPI0039E5648E
MITYIAGPMSGKPDCNRLAFYQAAHELKQGGDTVLNPATLPDGLTQAEYMRIGLAMLQCAQGIFLLEGWQGSEGAHAEYSLAKKLQLLVRYQS